MFLNLEDQFLSCWDAEIHFKSLKRRVSTFKTTLSKLAWQAYMVKRNACVHKGEIITKEGVLWLIRNDVRHRFFFFFLDMWHRWK